ncbi:MAG: hypothetical protein FJ041_02340 [Candidatus Cloacimonetes bacterium]|nr:hypothetical protein [Candidatus Cloacimonadota bacterium]
MKRVNRVSIILLLMVHILFIVSCELKRNNPLDPNGNTNIKEPPKVMGLIATGSSAGVINKYAELTWSKNDKYTDGYYVYIGFAYNSSYLRLPNPVLQTPDNSPTITIRVSDLTPQFYYFKVSAFKNYGSAGTLEGSLSEWARALVN